jgi:gliding motility-associated lipoprotein GldH
MKRAVNTFFIIAVTAILFTINGCKNAGVVVDQNTPVANHNWGYLNKIKFNVKIDDEKVAYNLYMNLRVTADYKYSNMIVLITQTSPDKKAEVKRYELQLANKEGEWYGKGSGNLYSYQVPFRTHYMFGAKGVYQIAIEQNMRDNPLREVSDVGIRVEKAK